MVASRSRRGGVESAVRAFVADLGALSTRQKVAVTAAYNLARRLDHEEDAAKAATLSRELRIVTDRLSPAAAVAPRRSLGESGADPVQRLQDEVARKRRERGATG